MVVGGVIHDCGQMGPVAPRLRLLYWVDLHDPLLVVEANSADKVYVDGLNATVVLSRDKNGVVHVSAPDEASMAFAQGYVHARDRLFQMDLLRRTASGTLAELLGKEALADDILLRTIGLCRAAKRTLPLLGDQLRSVLDAYAKGVNAFKKANSLPPEYPVLNLGEVIDWSPLDSVCIAKLVAFQLSADTDDIDRTEALFSYQASLGEQAGTVLFFQDLWRIAPFEPISIVPLRSEDAGAAQASPPVKGRAAAGGRARAGGHLEAALEPCADPAAHSRCAGARRRQQRFRRRRTVVEEPPSASRQRSPPVRFSTTKAGCISDMPRFYHVNDMRNTFDYNSTQ